MIPFIHDANGKEGFTSSKKQGACISWRVQSLQFTIWPPQVSVVSSTLCWVSHCATYFLLDTAILLFYCILVAHGGNKYENSKTKLSLITENSYPRIVQSVHIIQKEFFPVRCSFFGKLICTRGNDEVSKWVCYKLFNDEKATSLLPTEQHIDKSLLESKPLALLKYLVYYFCCVYV